MILIIFNFHLAIDYFVELVMNLQGKIDSLEQHLLKALEIKNETETDRLLTVDETAQFLNLAKPTIYSKVSRNELPVMKRGKRLYFSHSELLEYIKEGRKKTDSEIEAEAEAYLSNKKRVK